MNKNSSTPGPVIDASDASMTDPVSATANSRWLALRVGVVALLVSGAVAFTVIFASDVSQPAPSVMTTVPAMVQPLQDDLQALLISVVPNPPDLNPTTTGQLQTAVADIADDAAAAEYASAGTRLDDLEQHLSVLLDSRTGTLITQSRGQSIQHAIDAVRNDLDELK